MWAGMRRVHPRHKIGEEVEIGILSPNVGGDYRLRAIILGIGYTDGGTYISPGVTYECGDRRGSCARIVAYESGDYLYSIRY